MSRSSVYLSAIAVFAFFAGRYTAWATGSSTSWVGTTSTDVTNSANYSGAVPGFGGTADLNLSVLNGSNNPFTYGASQGTTVLNGYLYLGTGSATGAANTFNLTGGTVSFGAVAGSSYNQNVIALTSYSGTLNVTGGTLNFLNGNTGDSSSLWLGNNGQTGNLNVSAGTVAVQNGLIMGRDTGTGLLTISGTGIVTVAGTAGTVIVNAGRITFGSGSGIFKQTGLGTINFGSNGYVNFQSSGTGALSLLGAVQSYFDGLVSSGKILLDGAATTASRFAYTSTGGQGVYQLRATMPNSTPAINSALTAAGTVGTAFSYAVTASNSPTSFGASNLPPGLSINTTTGAITGTPTFTGISSVTLSAVNPSGTGTATLRLTAAAAPTTTAAKPFLHPLFTNNMVLQRDEIDPVWGWTAPEAGVTVVVKDQNGATLQTATATAAANGRWQANIGPFGVVPNNAAYSLSVTGPGSGAGAQTVTLTNVLIGDVWLFSGQSNVEYTLYGNYPNDSGGTRMANSTNEISAASNNNFIRQFKASRGTTASTPQDVFVGGVDSGGWTTASANAAAFTAVGYFTSAQIYASQNVPIGMLNIDWGGTDITAWVPAEYVRLISDYTSAIDTGGQTQGYYNAMIAPAISFQIKGLLWYQGESSTQLGGPLYGALLAQLRDGFRAKFGQSNLPFIAVQVCTNGSAQTVPVEAANGSSYAEIREAQVNTALADANSRAVVTIDCTYIDPSTAVSGGTYNANVHPVDKQNMGLRAGQAALNVAYGKSTQYLSPTFDHATVSSGAIRCYFNNVGNGLMVGLKPQGLSQNAPPSPSPVQTTSNPLTGFAVAGANKTYYNATATLDTATNTVLVSSPSVAAPLYVRYGWGSNPWNTTMVSYTGAPNPNPGVPSCNLYGTVKGTGNSVVDGVPVAPFRNDPVAQLSVNSGSGSGSSYAPGQQVGVTANGAPSGQAFAFWSGDTDLLANANGASTMATLSRTYVSIRANYHLNAAPTGLSGYAYSLRAALTWNPLANATTYSIKRASAGGGPYTTLATGITTQSYADDTVGAGTTWYYVVSASNAAGESPNSAPVSVIPYAPGTPSGVTVMAGSGLVAVAWNAVANATGYTVARSTVSGGNYAVIASGIPGTSYVDTTAANGTAYYYVVTATYGSSAGSVSSEVSATPAASSTPVRRSLNGASSASAFGNSGESDMQAFDQNTGTKWLTTSPTGWVQYQFGSNAAWAVSQYQVTSGNDVPARDPKSWQLLASNDNYTWFVLDTRAGETFASRQLTKTYTFTNTVPYRYYRLNVTTNSGDGYLQLSEFALFSPPSDPGDKTVPLLSMPANITVLATGVAGAAVTYAVSATDAVSGSLTPACSPASGTVFPIGTTTVNCTATDIAGNKSAGGFMVTVQPSFASYLGTYFSAAELADPTKAGPLADFDGDGRTNLLEYFEGTNPRLADADNLTTRRDGNGNAVLGFRMAKNLSGVSYRIQSSTDLATWSVPTGVTVQLTSDQGSYSLMEATVPVGGAARFFLRLSVSMP